MTDERDRIDPALDAAWRAHVREEPPRTLDDAILAAAHRAVTSGPRAQRTPWRWTTWAPLAVAATLGAVAFGVVQLAPHEEDATRSVVGDAPVASSRAPAASSRTPAAAVTDAPAAPAPAPTAKAVTPAPAPPPVAHAPLPAPRQNTATPPPSATSEAMQSRADAAQGFAAAPPAAEAPRDQLAKRQAETTARLERQAANEPRKPEPFPAGARDAAGAPQAGAARDATAAAPAAAPASPAAAGGHVGDARRGATDAKDVTDAAPAPAAAPMRESATASTQPRAKVATTRTPDDFVGEIRRLRGEKRDADAALVLAAFRAAYVDADERLPAELRAWARTIARP